MLKVCIIGCGQIAEAHVEEIRKTRLATVECVCDREPVMAQQLAKRYAIPKWYTDPDRMFENEKLDAAHIATPPQTHYEIAVKAIDNGCHVLVEKPITMNYDDTRSLIRYAEENDKIMTAGYAYYFDPPAEQLRKLVGEGRIGIPVHVESFYGYDLGGTFGSSIMSDPNHWVHKLPGKMFHNNIDHLIYRFIEYVPVNENSEVKIISYRKDESNKFNDSRDTLKDELRVILRSGSATGLATFSSNIKPVSQFLRIYGTRAIASIDYISRGVIIDDGTSIPTALGRALIPFTLSRKHFACGVANLAAFHRYRFQYFAGFKKLFTAFFASIIEGGSPPIPYEHLLSTAYLVDLINSRFSMQVGNS